MSIASPTVGDTNIGSLQRPSVVDTVSGHSNNLALRLKCHRASVDSMTGGVGTAFYRAPEQEGKTPSKRGESSYDEHAKGPPENGKDFDRLAFERFPKGFTEKVPKNAQRMILWCLERDPSKRPSAEALLNSDLLPRKIEVEQRYLEEALQTLANPQSESYNKILEAMFDSATSDLIEMTFDTDVAAKANNLEIIADTQQGAKRVMSPSEAIMKAITDLRAAGTIDIDSHRSDECIIVDISNGSIASSKECG